MASNWCVEQWNLGPVLPVPLLAGVLKAGLAGLLFATVPGLAHSPCSADERMRS